MIELGMHTDNWRTLSGVYTDFAARVFPMLSVTMITVSFHYTQALHYKKQSHFQPESRPGYYVKER